MDRIVFDINSVTKISLFGITILEPVTVLTNLLITAVCLFAFFKLGKFEKKNSVTNLFRYFFLFMGLATATGGILGHGLLYLTGQVGKLPGWYISMLSIAFIERAAIQHSKPLMHNYWGNFFSILNYVEVAVFLILAFITLNFRFVEAHATYGLFVIVFCFELYTYYKKKDNGSKYMFVGTVLAAAAALTHTFKLSLHEWFNYNDVSHVIMATGIYFYYLGAINLQLYDQPNERTAKKILAAN